MTEKDYYSISEAVAMLQPEFLDLSSSSLRFLEKQGFLQPQRTLGGHRMYSEKDISRIRLIKRFQSQRYYPLEVIRHVLVKLERAADPDAEMAFLESLYSPLTYDPNFTPIDDEQLADRTGLSLLQIDRLEKIGLLFPQGNGNDQRRYDEDDLKVAKLVSHELELGANVEDFVPYAEAMRTLVQEEFNLFYKLIHEEHPLPERVRQLKETADLVHSVLRAKLTRQVVIQVRHGQHLEG